MLSKSVSPSKGNVRCTIDVKEKEKHESILLLHCVFFYLILQMAVYSESEALLVQLHTATSHLHRFQNKHGFHTKYEDSLVTC